jgi:hypothetical protein
MNDTSDDVARLVAERHRSMTPEQRLRIASSMYETARSIIASSLPKDLSPEQRRYAIARRFYGNELPEAALLAHARYSDTKKQQIDGGLQGLSVASNIGDPLPKIARGQ